MFQLTPFAASGILIVLFYSPLLVVIIRKGKTTSSKIFALHILSVLAWGLGSFLIGITRHQALIVCIWKLTYTGVLFIPVFFYHFVLITIKRKSNLLLPFSYFQAVYFVYAIFRDKMMASVTWMFDSFYFHIGTPDFFISFIIWMMIAMLAHFELIRFYTRIIPSQKKQIAGLFLAAIGYIAGAMNFLPALGINLYPYANFLVPFHAIFISWSVFRHDLLDIKIAYKQGFIYTILLLLLSLIYLSLVIFIEKIIQNFIGYNSITITVICGFIIGIICFPLKNKIQLVIDHYFFKATPIQIAEENVMLRKEVADKEKMKAVASLASGLAHEIRNPLTAIKTFIEYYPKKKNDPDFETKFNTIVGKEIHRIDDLINNLLQFAKPSPLSLKKTKIIPVIESSLDLLSSQLKTKNIQVHKDYQSDPILKIDENKMKQVFLNLFLNAIEAMEDGGTIAITVSDQRPATSNKKRATSHETLVTIRDSGPGIPKDQLKKIFTPFHTTKATGTGLGLAVTKGIIEDHGGKIEVSSKTEKGTEIKLYLRK